MRGAIARCRVPSAEHAAFDLPRATACLVWREVVRAHQFSEASTACIKMQLFDRDGAPMVNSRDVATVFDVTLITSARSTIGHHA